MENSESSISDRDSDSSGYTAESSGEESTVSMSSPEPRKVKKCQVERKHKTQSKGGNRK